jgi:carbonic anhydrase
MISAAEALERLKEGNRRFASGIAMRDTRAAPARRSELVSSQQPFAVVLGCSDSRVPVEIVFDQSLGDLFVVRVVGSIAGSSQIESVAFAIEQLGTRLVVVLGHARCGAVLAILEELQRPTGSRTIRSIVEHVRPAVAPLLATALAHDPDALVEGAVRANVRASVNDLRQALRGLGRTTRNDEVEVVGAEYSLATGVVEFFDGVPERG